MKHKKALFAGCMLSLLSAGTVQAVPVPNAGQDKMVEWQTGQNWSFNSKALDMVHTLDGKYVYILNANNTVQIYSTQGQLQGSIPVEEGVTAIDISPQGEALYLLNSKDNSFKAISVAFVAKIDTAGSPFRGPADAPVTIALFTDFQ